MDNFTKIDNELLEFLYLTTLSKNEIQVMLFIIRHTSGFNRYQAVLTNNYIANGTGIEERNIKRIMKKLEEKELITIQKIDGSNRRIISLRGGSFYHCNGGKFYHREGGKFVQNRVVSLTPEGWLNQPPKKVVSSTTQEKKTEKKTEERKKEETDFTSFLPENLRDKDTDDMTEEEFAIWLKVRDEHVNL